MQKRTGGNGGNGEFSGAAGYPGLLPPPHRTVSRQGPSQGPVGCVVVPLCPPLPPVQLNRHCQDFWWTALTIRSRRTCFVPHIRREGDCFSAERALGAWAVSRPIG